MLKTKLLKEEHDFMRAILDSVSDEIAVIDGNGVIVMVNTAWRKFAIENGLESDTSGSDVGSNYLSACQASIRVSSDNPQQAIDGIQAVLDGRLSTFSLEYPCHSPDQQRWFKMKVTPLGPIGHGAVIAHTNITEFKMAEESLRLSEERWKFALEGAGDGVWDVNLVTMEAIYSRRYQEMLGYAEGEFKNVHSEWLDHIHPEDQAQVCEAIAAYFDRQTDVYATEYRLRCKDGSYKWIYARGMVVDVTDDGQPLRMVGTHTDITERRRAEQTYRTLFRTVRQGVIYQDAEGRITSANPAAEGILGLSFDQLQGRTSIDPRWRAVYQDGAPFPGDQHPITLALKTGQPISGVVMGIYNPLIDHTVWIRIDASPVFKEGTNEVEYAYACFDDITEQLQLENALRESEQRFRNIANAAPLMIWVAGTDKLCNWFSHGWLSFTGRTLDQELGNGWTDGVHPDDFQQCVEIYHKHFNLRQAFHMEYRLRHHSGEYRWIYDNGVPRFDANNEFLGYIGSCVDISKTHKAQEALLKSQQMLDEAQHIAHLGSWDWSIVDGVVSWSDEAAQIYVPDDTNTPPSYAAFVQCLHEGDREKVGAAIAATLERNEPYDIEYRVVSKSKGERIVHAQAKVYRDIQGKAIRLVGTVHDINDHQLAEKAVREAQEQLKGMTAAVPGVVYQFVLTPAGEWKFLYVSKGIEDLYEVTVEDAVKDHEALTQCIVPEDRVAHFQSIERSAISFSNWEHEYRIKTPNGKLKWVRGRATPQRQTNGNILWNGILSDVTEQKEVENALRLSASVFEHAQESIMITDADCNLIDVNAAFTRSNGYTRSEVLGKNPRILQSGQYSKDFYQAMWRTIIEHGHWSGELWNRSKSGEHYAELLTISAVKDGQGHVTHYVGVSIDITHIKKHHQELEHIAHHDALTGLPNRILLADRMQQSIAHAKREHELLAVCYLDLDGFKPINDSLGHKAGDFVLIEIAKRLGETIRSGDTVARLGGDEFVILLLALEKAEDYMLMLDRLLKAIAKPIVIEDKSFSVGASIGVSLFPYDAEDSDILLRQADQAMYIAKQSGKNRYQLYSRAD